MHPLITNLFPGAEVRCIIEGNINEMFLINYKGSRSVIKINLKEDYPEMFRKEAEGLKQLSASFSVPRVIRFADHEKWQFLEMQFIKECKKNDFFWLKFGEKLARTHQNTSKYFGYKDSNFIGSLVQNNNYHSNWESFLTEERLAPMIEMAVNSGEVNYVESKIIENLYRRINEIYPHEAPALLHGDLWSGNYISSSNGPVLIDPAVYYGHREMDLGMMHLFGGFEPELYERYNEIYPLEKGWKTRININQLYPLLVHLNLFGRSYWQKVCDILKPFT